MEREKATQKFQDQCFAPLFTEWTQTVTEQYGKDYERVEKLLLVHGKAFLAALAKMQERMDCQVCILTFSVLWTSLLQGKPAILIEAYEDIPFGSDPVLSEKIPAPWLFYGWAGFIDALERKCGELALNTYIRPPEIRAKAFEAAQNILITYCMMMKAHLRQLPQSEEWAAVRKQVFFFVSAGEYMERQLPLLGERPELDLAYLENGTDARFSKFKDCTFAEQTFTELFLTDSKFYHCTFRNVAFERCALCDALFVDCTFENCSLSDLSIMGAEFYATRFTDVRFNCVWSDLGQSREKKDCVSCGRTTFTNCLLERVQFNDSDLGSTQIGSCQFIGISADNSILCPTLQNQISAEEG